MQNHLIIYIRQRRYECLLLSFLVLIFGNTFNTGEPLVGIIAIYLNFLTGLVVFFHKKALRIFIAGILILTILLDLFEVQLANYNLRTWHNILYMVFFFWVSKEVYKEVLYSKRVTRELLAAALCGFILLCMIATFLFYILNMEQPHSFTNVGQGREALSDLNYFSFTTLLTIGFGDIVPVTTIAKRTVMLMGLASHFYTVFVTSIIIGKYLSERNKEI